MDLAELLKKRGEAMKTRSTSYIHTNPNAPRIAYFVYEKDANDVKFLKLSDNLKDEFTIIQVTGQDIQNGVLSDYECLYVGGGYHTEHYHHMGKEDGKIAVQKAIESGCGFIGVCAGAYLACTTTPNDTIHSFCPTWNLLSDCVPMERNEPEYIWQRGMGPCKHKLTKSGKNDLKYEEENVTVFYRNGPCMIVQNCTCSSEDQPCVGTNHVLGVFETEYKGKNVTVMEGMRGSAAIVSGMYGNGKVCIFSAHPEISDPVIVDRLLKQSIRNVCKQI